MAKVMMPDMATLVKAVNEILERFPNTTLTLRQVYYQLVAAHIIENNINSYKSLSRMLVKARENGEVDDSRIEDRGRQTIGGDREKADPETFYKEYEDFFRTCWEQYSRPMWEGQPHYVECWLEKDALSRIVSDIASRYGVKTCIARGYSSYTFLKDASDRINRACYPASASEFEDSLDPIILYFGDHDPSGVDMVRDLGVRLERYGVTGGTEIVNKIALNRAQIDKYNLPPDPTKEKDARAKKFIAEHGNEVVELDALNPDVLQELVKSSILKTINSEIWNQNARESQEEQTKIKAQVDAHFER
jgi:hypothetical protein